MPVKVCVIGVGYLGVHHARIYSGLPGVRLVAVADSDMGRAKKLASQYGAEPYEDYRNALDIVDAVSVVTPTTTHHAVALDCLRAGRDVLVEKPMTSTVAEADSLIAEAERGGRILQVGHLERFNPAVVALSRYADSPEFIEAERLSPFLGRGLDVDVTLDLMIHDIDIVMSLMGGAGVRDVRAVGASVLSDKLDVAKAWVEFDGGTTALITASRVSKGKERILRLYQKDSYVVLDYQRMKITRHFVDGGNISSEAVEVEGREPLKDEIEDFVECVRTRRRPRVSGEEGRDALKVALDITEKVRRARRQP